MSDLSLADIGKAFAGMSLEELEKHLAKMPAKQVKELVTLAEDVTGPKIWAPNPGPQTAAYLSEADELFYGGSAGGGKTALLCGAALNDHKLVRILRRQSVQVSSLVGEVRSTLGHTKGLVKAPQMCWSVPDGPIIDFNGVQHEDDKSNFQGQARDLLGFDEITEFTPSQYRFIIGWNRPGPGVPKDQRCRVICTGNPPIDDDGMWVIDYWAPWLDPNHPNPALPGELRWFTTVDGKDFECPNSDPIEIPDDTKEAGFRVVHPRSRTFIPASLEDNPDLMETNYASVLESMPEELRVRLRDGKFSATIGDDEFQVIPRAWVEAACARWTETPPDGQMMSSLGVDCARGGADAMTMAPRYGLWFAPIERVEGRDVPDGQTAVGHIARVRRDNAQINLDVIGIGSSVHDFLKENGIKPLALNASAATPSKDKTGQFGFANLRAEMWWRMREALDPSNPHPIALPRDPRLKADLCAPRFKITARGYQIESKDDIRQRIGRSPDDGDAAVMANYSGDSSERRRRRGEITRHPTVKRSFDAQKKRMGW